MRRVGSEFHWIGFSVRGVGVDIAAKLAGQILHAGKDSSSNHVVLDLGKPNFDLLSRMMRTSRAGARLLAKT
jgi:hypothetical protein